MHHPNRYVREAAHAGACALCRAITRASLPAADQPCSEAKEQCSEAKEQCSEAKEQHLESKEHAENTVHQGGELRPLDATDLDTLHHPNPALQPQQQAAPVQKPFKPQGEGAQRQDEASAVCDVPPQGCSYSLLGLGRCLAPYIADGLTDNWSQVRQDVACDWGQAQAIQLTSRACTFFNSCGLCCSVFLGSQLRSNVVSTS